MNYSQEEFKEAKVITGEEYCELENPRFEGQTKCDSEGNYKMYWSNNGELYCTENNLHT